jgi:hypothetical protein
MLADMVCWVGLGFQGEGVGYLFFSVLEFGFERWNGHELIVRLNGIILGKTSDRPVRKDYQWTIRPARLAQFSFNSS